MWILSYKFNLQERAEKVELEKWRMKEKELQERMEEDAKDLEKMTSRHNTLMAKVDECTKKISDLGSLPQPEMINKYMNLSQKAVSTQCARIETIFRIFSSNNLALVKISAVQRNGKS